MCCDSEVELVVSEVELCEVIKCWLQQQCDRRVCCFVLDLFEKVVPLAIQQAVTMFENRRAEVVNCEIGRLREATQLMNRYNWMRSLYICWEMLIIKTFML